MKLAIHCFSAIVRKKSVNLKRELITQGLVLLPWRRIKEADGAIVYNIHQSTAPAIRTARSLKKPFLSLQEGMYALGWQATLTSMKKECKRANELDIMQFVWSDLDKSNYITTGKKPELLQHYGNPEHDDLIRYQVVTKTMLGIPKDAFVIVHIDQYSHPSGNGPSRRQLKYMFEHVRNLAILDERIWVITCLHPKQKRDRAPHATGRCIIRPFSYSIFDILRLSDLVVTVSSTEGITAAILEKPIVEYDISNSPSRWPFVEHGVAFRATLVSKLEELTKLTMAGSLEFPRSVNYRQEYHVDGQISKRVAEQIVRFFT